MSEAGPTLRDRLREVPPHDVALKVGLRALIQALRLRKRATGEKGLLMGQADVDRLLGRPVLLDPQTPDRLRRVKEGLRSLVREALDDEARMALAARVDEALRQLVPRIAEAPVPVRIQGWPADLPPGLRARILRRPEPKEPLPPEEAARLLHEIDGLVLAGQRISVEVDLPPGEVLPPLPREQRFDRSRWGRAEPWLPFLDEEGRFSLTPEPIARRQARLLAGVALVIDAFCGCGGNAIAFAREGLRVIAIERDPQRIELARQNTRGRVELIRGDAAAVVPRLLDQHPDAALFLDPPWGGLDEVALSFSALLPDGPWEEIVRRWPRVLLKLPTAFDVSTLPQRPGGWRLCYELGEEASGDAHLVRMLTAEGRS